MFMFDGTWAIEFDERERLYRARLGALFRNALAPGQYPYPFWHSAKKWNDYQSANAVVFWIKPESGAIMVGQFTNDGRKDARLKSLPVARPPFDRQWMWTDADGTIQPQPDLFRGLFTADNPYLVKTRAELSRFLAADRQRPRNVVAIADRRLERPRELGQAHRRAMLVEEGNRS